MEIDFKRLTRPDTSFVNNQGRQREFVRIGLSGAYYAGGPVKHGQVRWKLHKSKTSYQVPGHDNFDFGYTRDEPGELIESGQAILDEKGPDRTGISPGPAGFGGRVGLSGDCHGGGL